MIKAIGSTRDPALEPAAAASEPVEAGADAARAALDRGALEGRNAVRGVNETAATAAPTKGGIVDRTA